MKKAFQEGFQLAGIVAIIGLGVMAMTQRRDNRERMTTVDLSEPARPSGSPRHGIHLPPPPIHADLTPEEQQAMEAFGVMRPSREELTAIISYAKEIDALQMSFAGKGFNIGETEAAERPAREKLKQAIGEDRGTDVIAMMNDNGYRELMGKGVDRGTLSGWLSLWELSHQMPSPLGSREKARRAKDIL